MVRTNVSGIIDVYEGNGENPGIDVRIAVIRKYTLLTLKN
jgi:hypothetical protein